jgi:hypothetical protein
MPACSTGSTPENATLELLRGSACSARHGADLIAALETWQPAGVPAFRSAGGSRHLSERRAVPLRRLSTPGCFTLVPAQTATRCPDHARSASVSPSTSTPHEDFRACLDAGMTAAAGWFFTVAERRAGRERSVRDRRTSCGCSTWSASNADIREIEDALKLDVAISYKLLRYINSAGFRPVLRDPVVPARRQHARLRQAQPLAVTAAGDGQQGPDGARA